MSNRLLFVDTETGGLDPQKHSLLSVGLVVWDESAGEIFSDEIYVGSENYNVTKSAVRINHFDESAHRAIAIPPHIVVEHFFEVKEKYFKEYTSIPLAGHNTVFDVQFIKQLFLTCGRSYEKLFSHRILDTYSIIKCLSDCQIIPHSVNSSASAFKYFGISVIGRHTALGDARATMQLYSKIIELLKKQQTL